MTSSYKFNSKNVIRSQTQLLTPSHVSSNLGLNKSENSIETQSDQLSEICEPSIPLYYQIAEAVDSQSSNTNSSRPIKQNTSSLELNKRHTNINTTLKELNKQPMSTNTTLQQLNKQLSLLEVKIAELEQIRKRKKDLKKLEKKKKKDKKRVIKRAILIGINYIGSINELTECVDGMQNLANLLIVNNYFKSNEIILMNDNSEEAPFLPTKQNIINQFESLIQLAEENSACNVQVFIAYSGHGSYLYNNNINESKKGIICPVDYEHQNYITGEDFNDNFIFRLPKNVKLLALMDACFTGTELDLRYNYAIDQKGSLITSSIYPELLAEVIIINSQNLPLAIIKNKQTLYDYQGALICAFIANYKHDITYKDLIIAMRIWLETNKYSHVLQLLTGRQIITETVTLLSEFQHISI